MNKQISILLLVLLIVSYIPSLPLVYAASRTIDGDPSDWTGSPPTQDNNWVYDNGEWIWRDASRDERTDFSNPDPQVDLLEFRITGDTTYLYLLFKFNFPAGLYIGDDGATFIALAIDRDRTAGSGVVYFAGESETQTSSDAAWEYQLVINLADSRYRGQNLRSVSHALNQHTDNWGSIFQLINTNWGHIYVTNDDGTNGLLAVNLSNNAIEVRLKWELIGGRPDSQYVRFTLITARGWSNYAANQGGAWDIGGSDALDAVTTTGPNTWDEVQDGDVDYYADVYFVNGEPTTPPPPQYRVYGYVMDQYGDPIPSAEVELNGYTNTTLGNGYFEVRVPSGNYTLIVRKLGYDTYRAVINVSGGDVDLGVIVLWKFIIDITSNVNDFPTNSRVYQAPRLITATGDSQNALTVKHVAWDEKYIYIGVDFAPGTWGLALGIGIDANPGTTYGYGIGASDSWGRKIGFIHAYIDYQAYFWVSGGTIQSVNYNKYKPDGTWDYNFAPIYYSPLATGHDGSTLFKIAIPWSSINTTTQYNGTVVIVTWIAGGTDSSAVSSLPLNPDVLTAGSGEWGDTDTIYMYLSITVDLDSNGLPDSNIQPVTRTRFHPLLDTTVATDKDTYTVIVGQIVNVETTLRDQLNYLLPLLDINIVDSGGSTVASGYTGLNGKVILSFTAPNTPGTYSYRVVFNGHAGWRSSEKTITVVAEEAPIKIYGYVKDRDTNYPIPVARVELLDSKTWRVIAYSLTTSGGYYEIPVSPGVYILRVSKTGYANYTVKVVVTGDTRVDVYLMRRIIDLTRNTNDFPTNSIVYIAKDFLTTVIGAKHNLSRIYIAWDTENLYIGTDLAPEECHIAYGIGIDVNPGNDSTGYGAVWCIQHSAWEDGWSRRINFTTPYTIGPIYPELQAYFWISGRQGVNTSMINRYMYEYYPPVVGSDANVNHWYVWWYNYTTPLYSPLATTKDGRTLFKVAIPWVSIMSLANITYTGEIALAVWVAHDVYTSAVTALPLNPLTLDKVGWAELGDSDVMYMTIKITYDADKDYTPDIVDYNTTYTFYPELSTTVETDRDVYETGTGMTVTIRARVKDALGNYLPFVKVELYDHRGVKISEKITKFNTGALDAFTAEFTITAPPSLGEYQYKVKFIGEAGFLESEKIIIINVTRTGTRIAGLTYRLVVDADRNNRVSSGDTIEVVFRLEAFNVTWIPLTNTNVSIIFNYTLNRIYDEVTLATGTGGYIVYRYVIRSIVGADIVNITALYRGNATYMGSSDSILVGINILRLIDGIVNDWGVEYPRSTPGIAPRGDEIVITDPVNDINNQATGIFRELDVIEMRLTYDGLYIYFFIKFSGRLTKSDHFTVSIAVDATPEDRFDGVSPWLYGYWYTDTRLGGFDGLTKTHIDAWNWTHTIEAIPIENKIHIRIFDPITGGFVEKVVDKLAVNIEEGFIEFSVPIKEIVPTPIDLTKGVRVWLSVFGVETKGKYFNPPGSNVIDVIGVGDTNMELLTTRDPDWINLVWPSDDIWIDTAFFVKFTAPGEPGIPDPSPAVPPSYVEITYFLWNGTVYAPDEFTYQGFIPTNVLLLIYVRGTQGRPVVVRVNGRLYNGVVGMDGFAQIPVSLPLLVYEVNITITSDGYTTTYIIPVTYIAPPIPEPVVLPLLIILTLLVILILFKKKK